MLAALARATQIITAAGFTVGSPLSTAQFTNRTDERIPLHGGTDVDGTTNVVAWLDLAGTSQPGVARGQDVVDGSSLTSEGYPVNFGTSFVMTVDLTGEVPRAWALLTYGESGDPTSPLYARQTVRFSEKNWREVAFTEEQISADPNLTEQVVVGT
jgi:acyl-homoserine-lactone acylase